MESNQEGLRVKILVCAHKITKTLKTDVFSPILLGTDYADDITKQYFKSYFFDNIEDNISEKQPNFSELSGMYWAWKNLKELGNPDYIGLFHYRRFLNFGEKVPGFTPWEHSFFDFSDDTLTRFGWNDSDIKEVCKGADLILTESEKILDPDDWMSSATLEDHYSKPHYKEDFDLAINTITKLYPEYIEVIGEFRYAQFGHFCNVFIMKRELFEEYAEWLFSILFDMEKYIDLEDDKYKGHNTAQSRVFGYLGERLLNCFVIYKKKYDDIKIREYQRLVGYLSEEEQKAYRKRYFSPRLDPHNLTRKERIISAFRLVRDGMKYVVKKVIK